MSSRGHNSKRPNEVLVITPAFDEPEGRAAHVAGDLIAAISACAPFRFTWAAGAAARAADALPDIPGQTLLPMRSWNIIERLRLRWPFWNRASLAVLRQAIIRADCVWLHDTVSPGAAAACRMARKLRKPVLVTQHDNPIFAARAAGAPRRAWIWLKDRLMTARLLRRAHQVTFTSDAAARFYHRLIPFKAPVKIIPHGVDRRAFFSPSTEEYNVLRAKFALRDDQPVMLFVGHFEAASGLPVLRRLAQVLPKWRFWLVGQGKIRPESWYLPNVQVFRNRDRNRATLAELYQSADLLLLPGYDTESPRALQEALACGLSVMCSPAVVAGGHATPKCLVVNVDPASPENTAKHWLHKLKIGHAAWPASGAEDAPFDAYWDWPQIAECYADILESMCRAAA